jgi:hypothetical protein
MKRNFTLLSIASVLFFGTAIAQTTIPNGGFETWENVGAAEEEPTNWSSNKTGTGNASLPGQTCFLETTNPHSGTNCLKLENGSIFGSPVNATATTGQMHAPSFSPADGYISSVTADADFNSPFVGRPDSLIGWYRFTQVGGDMPRVTAILHDDFDYSEPDQNTSSDHKIAQATADLPTTTQGTWTRFSVPFVYSTDPIGTATPTHILVISTASLVAGGATEGSILWLDDVEVLYNAAPPCTETASSITETACDSYTTPSGKIWTSSVVENDTIDNAEGCDSVITIDLTIYTIDSGVTQAANVLTADESGSTYQWLNCPAMTVIAGATDQAYTALADGDYAVIVSNNGCADTSDCLTVNSIGINENEFGSELAVYPNPTNGQFSIDMGSNYESVKVTMVNLIGKVIMSNTYNKSQILNIDLEEPAGVYLLMIESENKNAVVRLVKK